MLSNQADQISMLIDLEFFLRQHNLYLMIHYVDVIIIDIDTHFVHHSNETK